MVAGDSRYGLTKEAQLPMRYPHGVGQPSQPQLATAAARPQPARQPPFAWRSIRGNLQCEPLIYGGQSYQHAQNAGRDCCGLGGHTPLPASWSELKFYIGDGADHGDEAHGRKHD
jgi:hypothetical protein